MHFLRASNPVQQSGPLKVLAVYVTFSGAWIIGSDLLVHKFLPPHSQWHTGKGLLFILTSGGLLYFLLRWMVREANRFELTIAEIFHQSEVGVFLSDPEGRILDCNNAFACLVEETPDQLAGAMVLDLIDSADRLKFRTEWHSVLNRPERLQGFQRVRLKNRSRLSWVSMTISRVDEGQGPSFLLGFLQNVSTEVEAFEKLRAREAELEATLAEVKKSELRCKRLVAANLHGTAICTLDGILTDANSELLRLIGRASSETVGTTLWDIFPPGAHDLIREKLSELNSYGRFHPVEQEIAGKDGSRIPVQMSGQLLLEQEDGPTEAAISLIDLREAKTKEAQLSRLALAVENAHESIVITDMDANIVYVNPAFERLTGYTPVEAMGKNPRFLRSGRTPKRHIDDMWATLQAGRVWQGRFYNKRKDGTEYEEVATVIPVRNSQDQVINYLAVKRDVTREQELEEQLLQSQKMEAIGQLASGVAHDLNNVLQVVQSSAELALWKSDLGHSRRKLEDILHASERGAAIVSQLLAFSRQQRRLAYPIDLNEVIRDTGRMLRRLLPEDVEVRIDLGKSLFLVEADLSQLTQVLLNMAVNARDAMPNGGIFQVRTRNLLMESASHGSGPTPCVQLSISDTGVGIEPALMQKIFEPFFTTKDPGKGTGLGLSMVHGIVKQSGGTITVESLPGEGATFEITFPATNSEKHPLRGDGDHGGVALTGTVLVCDDDPHVRSSLCECLESLGATTICCATAQEALNAATQFTPELLITDVLMPQMSGIELAEKIRAKHENLKVLFITGHAPDTIEQRYASAPQMDFLTKPFTARSLSMRLKHLKEPAPPS